MFILDGRSWLGDATGYGFTFLIELKPAQDGYHFAVICFEDGTYVESKRPCASDALPLILKVTLESIHGMQVQDFRWTEVPVEMLTMLNK